MTDGELIFYWWLALSALVFFIGWLNNSDIGQDILRAVHLVIRRRLRIWARGHGVALWEDSE